MLLCYNYCKGTCCGGHVEAWHINVQTELKRTSCDSEVAKEGISCYDASADSCIWNVRSTCCRSKEDCCHASMHGFEDFLYFQFFSRSDRIRGLGRLPYSFDENWQSSSIRLTLLDFIYKTESSDLIDNLSGMAYTNCQEEKSHRLCRLWIGTRHSSASEQPCTLVRNAAGKIRASAFLSIATSKYS